MPAVLLVALAGTVKSFPLLVGAGFLLGIGGTIFAVGVPFSSAWFPPHRRGFANGVFGMGMIGTAVSAFATPRLAQAIASSAERSAWQKLGPVPCGCNPFERA